MRKIYCLFCLVILPFSSIAQLEASRWIFGLNAGINFTSLPPVAIQSSINTTEGTTVSSDSSGNLNFYSDGVSVWDKNNSVMPNGSGLFGNVSTTVSALAVPDPGNSDLHYLFTLDEATGTNGFCYSVVDMSLQSGNGDVTLKNIPIQGNVTEKMAAVKQLGTNNTWVTVHEWGTDAFYSYLVTPTGFQSTPVISNAGMVHTIDALEQNKYGQMKFNTCGTRLALAVGYTDTVEVLDFDPATGIFSNPITLPLGDHVYGVEFSQDASMLYVTRYNTGVGYADLVQFDLTSGNAATILASMTTISSNTSGTNFYYALQLGLDEKIYVCLSWSTLLGVVDQPDVAGPGCNFNPAGFDLDPQFLGSSAALGLPAFVQSYFRGEIVCNTPIGVTEHSFDEMAVSPTLSKDGFMFYFNTPGNVYSLMVLDNSGRIISHQENISTNGFYFGNRLAAGSYVVRVYNATQSAVFRIMKL
jgi:hypothetical protein